MTAATWTERDIRLALAMIEGRQPNGIIVAPVKYEREASELAARAETAGVTLEFIAHEAEVLL